MIPKRIQEILIGNKFVVDLDECAVYKKHYKSAILGDYTIDIFDYPKKKSMINIVVDCEEVKTHELTESNIKNIIKEAESGKRR